jgi:uncharacterized protein (DUF433 family)
LGLQWTWIVGSGEDFLGSPPVTEERVLALDSAAGADHGTQRRVAHSDPEILGGTPVFVGTRVPLRNLIDYPRTGHSLDEFLDAFPSVSREQANVLAAMHAGRTPRVRSRSPRTRSIVGFVFSGGVMQRVVHSDPEILGGTPVFVGTRVPVKNLIDYLEAGDSLDEFLDAFPSVTREQAIAALELAREALLSSARAA